MAQEKEALARIKINQLLEVAGWRFSESSQGRANIQLEGKVGIAQSDLDRLGEDFEHTKNGYIDYLLLDDRGFPLCVLEAKKSTIHPLSAKDQARRYAVANNARFIILSNGDTHYLWDTKQGHPEPITVFPTQESLLHREEYDPNTDDLISMVVDSGFLAPQRTLRDYQVDAIHAIQNATKEGKNKYLLEMATGTGKTTVAGAICKLFLKSGNAKRILFLVDRIELEKQAVKSFRQIFETEYNTDTIKSDKWKHCEIVVSTIQTLMAGNRYRDLFSPSDFELVISDEAHRGLSGNSRAVFEYFIGYKLGLTATPKDYLKGVDELDLQSSNPKALEIRNLRDTYKTFGCENHTPTFRYALNQGVQDNFLLPPYTIDARTEITTQLLSDEGIVINDSDEENQAAYKIRDFEKKFFNEQTNTTFCRALLEKGLKDPFTGEFGKTLVFAVSQTHAAKLANMLCKLADEYFPGQYQDSDFAIQVTSSVADSQKYTEDFAENKLNGRSKFNSDTFPDYITSKTRICVTVGMMTTGYDCPDLLNVALMRPVYSPSDFIQMKGRGTRKHDFIYAETGETKKKEKFLLLDFFANCEYFEQEFDYKEKLKLTVGSQKPSAAGPDPIPPGTQPVKDSLVDYNHADRISKYIDIIIGEKGMKIDRELYPEINRQFELVITTHQSLEQARQDQDIDAIVEVLKTEIFDKPSEYWNAGKIRDSYTKNNPNLQRKLSLREMILKALGLIDTFKTREQRIEEEYNKFEDIYKLDVQPPERKAILKEFFENYLSDKEFREIIDTESYALLNTYPVMSTTQLKEILEFKDIACRYIKEYLPVEMNEFDWASA